MLMSSYLTLYEYNYKICSNIFSIGQRPFLVDQVPVLVYRKAILEQRAQLVDKFDAFSCPVPDLAAENSLLNQTSAKYSVQDTSQTYPSFQ